MNTAAVVSYFIGYLPDAALLINNRRAMYNYSIRQKILTLCGVLLLAVASTGQAYIGPGAGFAFIGSAFVFLGTILLALVTILLWPLQFFLRALKRRKIKGKASTKRVVVLGLDGLEPKLVDKYMAADKLPNLKALGQQGAYTRLGTTLPALSPVAWSSFQTGVNPGAHNIFDFLTLDRRLYFPIMASTKIEKAKAFLRLGKLNIIGGGSKIVITRKSQPFWKLLGKYGIFSNILRVPISYPPEKFNGNILSAMCTPDLKGTQGSFTFYTTDKERVAEHTGGEIKNFAPQADGSLRGYLEGPPLENGYAKLEFSLVPVEQDWELVVSGNHERLQLNRFTKWIELEFLVGRRKKVSGLARFCLRENTAGKVALYISPVNIHPEKAVLPIAKPIYFAGWLARKVGLFGTLGLMEDTWGRNELALDDQRFLDQTYLTHEERERMFMEVLDKTQEGLCVCVFDASDRVQHMFWRYLDDAHPSPREDNPAMHEVIPEMYERMDKLVGQVKAKLNKDDLLIVMSDHGFSSFRRGVNLNTWLQSEGYLTLKLGAVPGSDYLKDVDWSKTKAFAVGLAGIYLNISGREREGIVSEESVPQLKKELAAKLETLRDPNDNTAAVSKVFDTEQVYSGLYSDQAPDIIVGFNPGYRVSWDSVTGKLEKSVFSDNTKAWSGDHHIDPKQVPGILFVNRKLARAQPEIIDIAPSVLEVFGISAPAYMEGRSVFSN